MPRRMRHSSTTRSPLRSGRLSCGRCRWSSRLLPRMCPRTPQQQYQRQRSSSSRRMRSSRSRSGVPRRFRPTSAHGCEPRVCKHADVQRDDALSTAASACCGHVVLLLCQYCAVLRQCYNGLLLGARYFALRMQSKLSSLPFRAAQGPTAEHVHWQQSPPSGSMSPLHGPPLAPTVPSPDEVSIRQSPHRHTAAVDKVHLMRVSRRPQDLVSVSREHIGRFALLHHTRVMLR